MATLRRVRRPTLRSAALLLMVASITSLACGTGDGDLSPAESASDASSTVRDSAGVRIVEYEDSPGSPAGRLELIATYGTLDGPGAFGSVADVAVDDSGEVYVLDRQARRVTVWTADGTLVRTFGGGGGGPGELTNPNHVALRGDGTVLVGELFPAELHWYDSEGAPLRDRRLELPSQEEGVAAVLSEWRSVDPDITRVRVARVRTDSEEAVHVVVEVDGTGTPGDTLLRWTQPGATPAPPPIFAPSLSWDLLPDGRFAVAPGGAYEVRVHDSRGRLVGIYRRSTSPVQVNRELRERARTTFREGMSETGAPAAMLDALAEEVEIAPTLPAVQEIRVSRPNGTLWVAVPRPAVDSEELVEVASYDRYAADGSFLGRVEAPPRFRLLTVVDGVAYGVWRDPNDVHFVRAYRYVPTTAEDTSGEDAPVADA